ncbi:hypothetical protein C8R47DRAFT_1295693 [Mycena vitilis]|nr:hypothetical protein C8R47DRAFT_1295693 [Mycena vitilis]
MLSPLEEDRAQVKALAVQIADLERSISALRAEQKLAQAGSIPTTLATPTLWRAVSFSGKKVGEVEQILLWLSRSSGCPLSIAVDDTPCPMPDLFPVFAALVPHRARWGQVTFSVPSFYASKMEGPMPLLRHLHLSINQNVEQSSTITIGEAPMLRSVVLNYSAAAIVILPWTQLTSLTLIALFPHEFVPILQKTTNLVCCTLEVTSHDDGPPQPDIELPCLELLTLRVDLRENGCLPSFISPALCRLKIPERCLGHDPIESLTLFISKCGCKLHEMRITENTSVFRASYRQAFPSIPKLYIENPKIGEINEEEGATEERRDGGDAEGEKKSQLPEVEGDSDSDS